MSFRRFTEPCPGRHGELHDWHFDWEAKRVYQGPHRRQVTEYCTWCNEHRNFVEDVKDIEPELPQYGPFYKGLPPRVA